MIDGPGANPSLAAEDDYLPDAGALAMRDALAGVIAQERGRG